MKMVDNLAKMIFKKGREIKEKRIKEILVKRGVENIKDKEANFYLFPVNENNKMVIELLNKKSAKIFEIESLDELRKVNDYGTLILTSNSADDYSKIRIEIQNENRSNLKVIDLFPEHPYLQVDARIGTATAIAKKIYIERLPGAVAEAGVYKGDFAKLLNRIFPDRKLYLFDTFEGFTSDMLDKNDDIKQTDTFINTLKDTSVDLVMGKMLYKENIKIRKGLFPDSAKDIEEEFCFVNLDMDLYMPIYEGLHWFWNRLIPGGCIFVHDYFLWEGVTRAVHQFSIEKNLGYVCIGDGSTAVFAKADR